MPQTLVRQPSEFDQLLLSGSRTGLAEPKPLRLNDVAAHTRAREPGPVSDATLSPGAASDE
ncbi:MAG: hypothetical protein M3336_03440 [Chloroflexota bacterium]|nr:hypothetical protein [Chloroflexota bacterium]